MAIDDATLASYADWVGREETARAVVTAESCDLMAATLDRDDRPYRDGDPLPPMWIVMGFRAAVRRSGLGVDGHPARGGFLPPVALPRRMFAGARHRIAGALPIGAALTRTSRIASVTPKRGKSGVMVFVVVENAYAADGEVGLVEEQDIVYREAAAPGAPAAAPVTPQAVPEGAWRETWTPDTPTLTRFSALTWNAHRIHYDRPYATEIEGYPGLVVHGPLAAVLLADLVRRRDPRALTAFRFRAQRPMFDMNPVTLAGGLAEGGGAADVVAYDHDGAPCMSAQATFA